MTDRLADRSSRHPLDNPIWNALTTRQLAFSEGDERARRYLPEIAPFAAAIDGSAESLASLARLIPANGRVALFTTEPLDPTEEFGIVVAKTAEQMVAGALIDSPGEAQFVELSIEDIPEMSDLVDLTKPGPFSNKALSLGAFLGVWAEGALIAMAGERMKLNGFTELTAVCVHPDYRGRGLSGQLLAELSRRALARGEIPFLHVFTENTPAIGAYLRAGFGIRKRIYLSVITRR